MSMTAPPVTVGDVQNIQIGVATFSDANAAQLVVNAIAAGTTSLFAYANGLISSAFGTSAAGNYAPVSISVDNLILGGVPPAGALGFPPNELQNLTQNFAPPQANLATKLGLPSATIYVTEQMAQGLAAQGDTNLKGSAFTTLYGISTTAPPTQAQIQTFALNIQAQTGANAAVTVQEANFWINFYTVNGLPPGISSLQPWVAGLAAAAGDAIGAAIVDNTSGTNFSQQLVFNALVDNAQVLGGVKNADGSLVAYKVGQPLNVQQVPVPLQGQAPNNVFTLTPGVDTFTTSIKGAIFNALPASNPPLGVTNTLNAGDNLQDSAGDGTLNFTAIASLINPPLAAAVTMNGISTANIVNNAAAPAGFSGNITGLTTVAASGSGAPITLGTAGQGLNTALKDITFTSNFTVGTGFTAWMTAAALAGTTDTVTVHMTGVGTPGNPNIVNLDVTTGVNGYETMNVESKGGPNNLQLNTDATSTATIVETGDQNLTLAGSALNIANLKTYNGSAGTGMQNVFFNGVPGGVAATGGSANDTFTFTVVPGSPTNFSPASSVDGGGGVNTLVLEADTGAILLAGDAASIKNIATVVHITVPGGAAGGAGATGDLTADLAGLGSATTFVLAGKYSNAGPPAVDHNVAVSDITNAQTVAYTGTGLGDLTLTHQAPVALNAQINLVINSPNAAVDTIDQLTVPAGNGLLNINSIGAAADNVITKVATVAANVEITGTTHLTFGSAASPYSFANGIIDATGDKGGVTTWLANDAAPQTFRGGPGNDLVHFLGGGFDTANFAGGGADIAEFHNTSGGGAPIGAGNLYNNVLNFVAGDTVALNVADIGAVLGGPLVHTGSPAPNTPVAAGEAVNAFEYTTGTAAFANTVPANIIDFVTPQNVGAGETAQMAWANAFGAGGSILTNNAVPARVAAVFYDVTDQQAVYVVDTAAFGFIGAGDPIQVVGLVHMTQAQFNTGLAAFTAFV